MRSVTTDVVVVGSGAGGLLAAATARKHGLEVILVESTDKIGGSSAMSGGALWLPNNHLMAALGASDSPQDARTYLDHCVGEPRPASTPQRRQAYLDTAPALAHWLEELGLELEAARGYPDYYPEAPGGRMQGRSVECTVTDAAVLGKWRAACRFTIPIALKGSEAPYFARSLTTLRGFLMAANVIGVRTILGRLRGKRYVSGGAALITGLLRSVLDQGVGFWLNSPLTSLMTDERGDVTGVEITRDGDVVQIAARRGVVLAAGGFERNQALRERFLPQPTQASWSSGNPGSQGDALLAGISIGAATDLTEDAWWGPSFAFADGTSHFALWERTLPHSIIVDGTGHRYFNEAEPYAQAGHHMYERSARRPSIPSFLIIDDRHRVRYPLGMWPPGITPKKAYARGDVVSSDSLHDLAKLAGIDPAGLVATVAEFNGYAHKGKDQAFGRGESAYDRYYADPSNKPNPSLGSIEKAPFYALKMVPGDLGTKGGLVTDADARVLREDGSVIRGLYATGNCSASVMARSYPGAGGTLGPACVFAYRAALHIRQQPELFA